MSANKIQVKFLFEAQTVDWSAFIPVFQRWIQEQVLAGLLIDVADYKHVPYGPGILLVGHEMDYAIDSNDGRIGFLASRKREWPNDDLAQRLQLTLRQAAEAAQLLAAEPTLNVSFVPQELLISLVDRLHYPNTTATFTAVAPTVQTVLTELAGGLAELVRANDDERRPFTIQANITQPIWATAVLAGEAVA